MYVYLLRECCNQFIHIPHLLCMSEQSYNFTHKMIAICLWITFLYPLSLNAKQLSEISFPKTERNYKAEAFTVSTTPYGSVCMVDGAMYYTGATFSIAKTGPCVQYTCKSSGVELLQELSGCENAGKCARGIFNVNGCTSLACTLTWHRSGNDIVIQKHLQMTSKPKCKLLSGCTNIDAGVVPFRSGYCRCDSIDSFHCVI